MVIALVSGPLGPITTFLSLWGVFLGKSSAASPVGLLMASKPTVGGNFTELLHVKFKMLSVRSIVNSYGYV